MSLDLYVGIEKIKNIVLKEEGVKRIDDIKTRIFGFAIILL